MDTVIEGWSGKSNGLEIARERYLRFLELKKIGLGNLVDFMWFETTPRHFTYKKRFEILDQSLTDLDLALIADYGNICFGATVCRGGNFATVTVKKRD